MTAVNRTYRRGLRRISLLAIALPLAAPLPVLANNYGESASWQFQTPAERATQAAILDMIERRRGGVYAAPVYNTTIARQYNCSIAATATGNSGVQSALANSPTINGATATAAGNQSSSTAEGGEPGASIDGTQSNDGPVSAGVIGSSSADVRGVAWQALNSSQTNGGDQQASVDHASACSFGALN
jgi:hypothetical protein